ncbi:MAG: restriction endonuclease subunit S, partial [Treponema sp.]|nr:restriction endonuclease subunit S [Treponema sp.]
WCRLGEICVSFSTGPFGTMLHKADYVEKGGVPLVNPANIKNGYIDPSNIKLVSREKYSALQAYVLAENDVIIARRGDLRKCAVVSAKEKGWLAGTGAFFLHTTGIDTSFFKLFYTSSFAQNFLLSDSIGTTMDNLNQSLLSCLPFPLPPIAEQKRIVAAIEKFMPLIEEYGKKETELKAFNEQIGTLTKKAILQEAVQGKLVPQIAAEGNAKDLLEEIQKEKAKLIKEGKIKKEKPLSEISEDEIPFDIPENWCWCRLGEIVDTNIGLTYSPSDIITKGGTEVLRSNNIKNGKIVYDDLVHVSKNVPEKCLSKKGDLLICARNGSKALDGKSALIEQDGMAFGAFMAIVRSPINPYILHFINSPVYRAKLDGVNTTTINQITQDNLRETVFPLPPLAEQKRIVAAIENILPLCEKLGE